MKKGRGRSLGGGLLALCLMLGAPSGGMAFDGGAGISLGDQGSDFRTGQEVFLFPQGLFNLDERVVLQLVHADSPWKALDATTLWGEASGHSTILYNTPPEEMAGGAGFVLSPRANLQIGGWFGQYAPGYGAFLDRGFKALGWTRHVGVDLNADGSNETNDLKAADPYNASVEPGRKLDLFAAYRLADWELGLRLWWGSDSVTESPDNSTGPVNLYPSSGGDIGEVPAEHEVDTSVFGLREIGMGLGAGYTPTSDSRVDLGLQWGTLGATYTPNGLEGFMDSSGFNLNAKLRGMVRVASTLEVGGAMAYRHSGMMFKPRKQRDGGELVDMDEQPLSANGRPVYLDPPGATASKNVMPGSADCSGSGGQYATQHGPQGQVGSAYAGNELCPVYGAQYEEGMGQFDLSILTRYRPTSRVTFWGAVGLGRIGGSRKVSVGGDKWYIEDFISSWALPSMRVGFQGELSSWLDVTLGVHRRWQRWQRAREGYDSRIPDDEQGPLAQGATGAGNENNVNGNRRRYTSASVEDSSVTQTMLGIRMHYRGIQLVAQVSPDILFNGPYLAFGKEAASAPLTWVNLIYGWNAAETTPPADGASLSPHTPVREASRSLDVVMDAVVEEEDQEAQEDEPIKSFFPVRDY